jgi:prepilin-type N-terminal cleavage/methylation domain-containing protein
MKNHRTAFTLVELLIVISIIAIIAGMSMAALMGASEEGRRARARSQITKLDQLISEKWNSYRFRQLPIRIPNSTNPVTAAQMRLSAMRELMRMEMPDRLTDVLDPPVTGQALPAVTRAYQRKVTGAAASTLSYDQAEMLYLIVSEIRDGDKSALEFFMNSEIGDVDTDGMFEILDPWGEPIMFLRWAPGYSRYTVNDNELAGKIAAPAPLPEIAVSTFQFPDGSVRPDTFDPLKVDPRWSSTTAGFKPFQLRPLIFSGGPDKVYDIYTDDAATSFHYNSTSPPNDPYAVIVSAGVNYWMGMPADYANNGLQNGDNITNHGLEFEGE